MLKFGKRILEIISSGIFTSSKNVDDKLEEIFITLGAKLEMSWCWIRIVVLGIITEDNIVIVHKYK